MPGNQVLGSHTLRGVLSCLLAGSMRSCSQEGVAGIPRRCRRDDHLNSKPLPISKDKKAFSWEDSNPQCPFHFQPCWNPSREQMYPCPSTARTRQHIWNNCLQDLKLEALGMLSRDPHRTQLAGCGGETEIVEEAGFIGEWKKGS